MMYLKRIISATGTRGAKICEPPSVVHEDASLRGRPLFRLGGSAASPSPPPLSPSPDASAGAGLTLGGRPLLRLGWGSTSAVSSGFLCNKGGKACKRDAEGCGDYMTHLGRSASAPLGRRVARRPCTCRRTRSGGGGSSGLSSEGLLVLAARRATPLALGRLLGVGGCRAGRGE